METSQDSRRQSIGRFIFFITDVKGKASRRELWRVLLPWLMIILFVTLSMYANMFYQIQSSLYQKGVFLDNGTVKPGLEDYVIQYIDAQTYKLYGRYATMKSITIATGFLLLTAVFVRRLNDVCRPVWIAYSWVVATWFYTLVHIAVAGDSNTIPVFILQLYQFGIGIYFLASIYLLGTFLRASVVTKSQCSETHYHPHMASTSS